MASAAANYNKTLLKIQKLANNSAVSVQKLVNASNESQMTFNSAEAEKSRKWQEKMSKSAHQMEVEDLKKAGLNPVLSTGGSGAQSYTTSSASTDNDSGSSAIASLLSQELGAMSNMESARMSADAQLKASAQQAKANRFAAQQSAAATKYAADQSYKLGVYRAQMDYKARAESNEVEKWKTKNATASSWPGLIDKNLRNFGFYKLLDKGMRKNITVAFGSQAQKFIKKNSSRFFNSKGQITSAGYQNATEALNDCNIAVTRNNVNAYYKATMDHDQKALQYLLKQNRDYLMSKQTKGKVKFVPWKTNPGWR